jgi:hypothetical protein
MPQTDSIPRPDAVFTPWAHVLVNYITGKTTGTPPEWPHITEAERLALAAQLATWDTALMTAQTTPTPANNEAKRLVRAEVERYFRTFINDFLRRLPVTDPDRTAMGLHNRDSHPTTHGVPTTIPFILTLLVITGHRIRIHFRDETEERSEARPYGMNGCLLNYFVGDEAVSDIALLTRTTLMTRSPFTLDLTASDAGKVLSVAARWQNNKGELGPWSEIAHIVIG